MNAEARRAMRLMELTGYFKIVYDKTGGNETNKAEKAYSETMIRAKKYASPQTAKEYLDEVLRRVSK
jgi:hypothetical protein